MLLAHRIIRERNQRGWTQQHLADAAGLGLRTVQRLEQGRPAQKESLLAIAAVFELEVGELVRQQPTANPGAPTLVAALVPAGMARVSAWVALPALMFILWQVLGSEWQLLPAVELASLPSILANSLIPAYLTLTLAGATLCNFANLIRVKKSEHFIVGLGVSLRPWPLAAGVITAAALLIALAYALAENLSHL